MVGWFNFTAGCFYGCFNLSMVGQRQTNRHRQRKRQADRQTERKRDKSIHRLTNRQTDSETEKDNDGWLVVSILWMVASIDGCLH